MSRFDDLIDDLADQLVAEWKRQGSLSPEERAAELALLEWRMQQPEQRGPCVQAPAQSKGNK